MNPSFAIVQTGLEPLDFEKIRRAFRGVPGLTPHDANTVASEGSGIVCRSFTANQAAALQANLKTEGVAVEIVEESRLPVLPPGKTIHRIEITPEAMLVDDVVKGMMPIAWEQVYLIAAGSVQLTTLVRQERITDEPRSGLYALSPVFAPIIPVSGPEFRVERVSKEATDWYLRAQIILAGRAARYCIDAENFNFVPLGEGVTRDLAGNFCLLVRGLAAHAPKAMLSRGAASIVSDPCEFAYYPRKNGFQDDIIWMLWRAQPPAP